VRIVEPEAVLLFGSRAGSALALGLFGVLFGALGWGVRRECRRRGVGPRAAAVVGGLLFAGPLVLVYASSLGGFYELRVHADRVESRALLPMLSTRTERADLARVDEEPAFRGRWRLVLVDASGGRRESATASREAVESAARLLRERGFEAK
jgi:hypothetical protein